MKNVHLGMFTVVFILSLSGVAHSKTYDFDSMTPGLYSECRFNSFFQGVAFDNTRADSFVVQSVHLEPGFSGNAIVNEWYGLHGDSTTATFASPTDRVSVTLGDYGDDMDVLHLFAYDSSNRNIGHASFVNPWTSYAGTTLTVATDDRKIAWVEFYGLGVNHNSVYWDNFTFNDYPTAGNESNVPVPASVILMGSGLLGVLGLRRRNAR